jgi:hypothetical protein
MTLPAKALSMLYQGMTKARYDRVITKLFTEALPGHCQAGEYNSRVQKNTH